MRPVRFLWLLAALLPVHAATVADSAYTPEEDASFERGANAYAQLCHVCHGEDGRGTPIPDDPDERRLAPSLSGSRRVIGRPEYVITALLAGVTGLVDGENYQGQMVSMASYGDEWIADVASYIRNSFDNEATMITSNQVARIRKRLGRRTDPFTVEEILAMMPAALTNQASWKVTASHHSSDAQNALRGGATNAWTSRQPQAAGMWFQVELPEAIPVWDFNLASLPDDTPAGAGFPRRYKVQASMNGTEWSAPIAEGTGQSQYTLIPLAPAQAKMLRITLTAAPSNAPPWSISRMQILREGRHPSGFASKPVANSFE